MNDEYFMQMAIDEACKALWPFGAVVVKDGEVVAKAGSGDGQDQTHDPTAHAEVNAIRRAAQKLGTADLSGSILYASCEPCALCTGATWYAGIKKMYFGTSLDEIHAIKTNNKALESGDLAFPHEHRKETGIEIIGGILREQGLEMYANHPKSK